MFENDFAGYSTATSSLGSTATIDFDDVAINIGSITTILGNRYQSMLASPELTSVGANSQLAVGDPSLPPAIGDLVTVSAPNVFVPFIPNMPVAQAASTDVVFDDPVLAIGGWFIDAELGFASTGIDIGADGTLEAAFSADQGNFSASFLGLVSDTPFTTVRLHFSTGFADDSVALDDLTYASASTAVPEPTGLTIFAVASTLFVLGKKLRRRVIG